MGITVRKVKCFIDVWSRACRMDMRLERQGMGREDKRERIGNLLKDTWKIDMMCDEGKAEDFIMWM